MCIRDRDVSSLLKGPAKKPVKIKLQRPGEKKPFEVDVIREKISIDAVPYYGMVDPKTAYIRLSNFTVNCSEDVKKAFLELRKEKPEALILDMRSNPGLSLIHISSCFNKRINHGFF